MALYRHQLLDRYDSSLPGKPHFIQTDYVVSSHSDHFHLKSMYVATSRNKGYRAGVNKKEYRASSHGYIIDNSYIGKSEG